MDKDTDLNENLGINQKELKTKNFQRRKEDFICEKCKKFIKGNGYTNHCSFCLYSKHVDINPGDRRGECGGLMKPYDVFVNSGEYSILHRCEKCNFQRKNKITKDDSFDTVLSIVNFKK